MRALARGLGWFSAALGAAELLAPRRVARACGLESRAGVLRAYGAREMMAGLGLLMGGPLSFWLRARAAGDVLDLATLTPAALAGGRKGRRAAIAAAAVLGVTALDVLGAARIRGRL